MSRALTAMTIHSDNVRVMKSEVPHAFRDTYPFKKPPHVAVIDGMPLLMACERNIRSWDDLLRCNFARHIIRYVMSFSLYCDQHADSLTLATDHFRRYFRLGCKAVVLLFDDYQRVPASKAITQANRVKKKGEYEFGEGQQLPPTMPDKYNEKLSNRVFKRRVIDMVCNRVLQHITLNPAEKYNRQFVLDYTGCPIMFDAPTGSDRFSPASPRFMVEVPPMGEADIKFTRWCEHFQGDTTVFSIDGDFIPIALIHHEKKKLQLQCSQEGEANDNEAHQQEPFNMSIYRLKYKMPAPASASRKGSAAAVQASDMQKQRSQPLREYEYVNIPALYNGMVSLFQRIGSPGGCNHALTRDPFRHHYMRLLAVIIGLGGTDFSRGLPLIGPYTMWEMIMDNPSMVESLKSLYSVRRGQVRVQDACHGLACSLYMAKFASHFEKASSLPQECASVLRKLKSQKHQSNGSGAMDKFVAKSTGKRAHSMSSTSRSTSEPSMCSTAKPDVECSTSEPSKAAHGVDDGYDSDRCDFAGGYKKMEDTLKRCSSLSEKTLGMLPGLKRVDATFRNINWILRYWECTLPVEKEPSADADDEQSSAATNALERWDYSACYPHPVCPEYGFKYRKDGKRGKGRGKKRQRKDSTADKEDDENTLCKSKQGAGSVGGSSGVMCAVQWLDEGDETSSDSSEEV